MADALTTITTFINSPPGQLTAGVVLAGVVYKFFFWVEGVLTDMTKFEIAVWLVGAEDVNDTLQRWPTTFRSAFERLVGERHFTLKCFVRSCLISTSAVAFMFAVWGFTHAAQFLSYVRTNHLPFIEFLPSFLTISLLPDYLSLLKSRYVLDLMARGGTGRISMLAAVDFFASLTLAIAGFLFYCYFVENPLWRTEDLRILHELPNLNASPGSAPLSATLYPAFFTTVWAALYCVSGFVLIGMQRSSGWLSWFNHKFDIEKKPLSAIGLVAGALVAVVYWGVAVGLCLMKK